jgi:hypothetical protein
VVKAGLAQRAIEGVIMSYKGGDSRHRVIGGVHRARSRYAMLVHRTTHTDNNRNKNYSGVEVRVSREEFIEWFRALDFDGCSVDRIDNNGHYEIENMQVIPMSENNSKDRVKARDGRCVCYKCKEEKPLDEFATDNRRTNGRTTICKACDNKRKGSKRSSG